MIPDAGCLCVADVQISLSHAASSWRACATTIDVCAHLLSKTAQLLRHGRARQGIARGPKCVLSSAVCRVCVCMCVCVCGRCAAEVGRKQARRSLAGRASSVCKRTGAASGEGQGATARPLQTGWCVCAWRGGACARARRDARLRKQDQRPTSREAPGFSLNRAPHDLSPRRNQAGLIS